MSVDIEYHREYPHKGEDMMLAGCTTIKGVRHWEEMGLLGKVYRSPRDTRRYTDRQMDMARVIAAAKFGGWSLEEIKDMLAEYWVSSEAYEAIAIRLEDQMRACVRLVEALPKPSVEPVEYDI